jgi:ribonuclease T2
MKRILLLTLAILTGCHSQQQTASAPAPHVQPATAAANQPFDFYLLNLSWSPEFCHSHPNARECAQHAGFVLHGLWPQNNTGPYIENCSDNPGPANPSKYSDIYPDPGLLRHEWQTHGTCSGLAPNDFFDLARGAYRSVAIPPLLTQLKQPMSMPPVQIVNLIQDVNPTFAPNSIAISCGNNYLTAVEVCMNKQGVPIACGPIKSCRANTVRITPP